MLLTIAFALSFTIQPAFASAYTDAPYNPYINNDIETVTIDGTSYTYQYYYENDNRAINIKNNETGHMDKLVYDKASEIILLNNSQVSFSTNAVSTPTTAASGWESLGSSSHYISWAKATTVAAIAGMIAVYLGTLKAAGVIAAMGTTALGVLAASSGGGTVNVELQWFYAPFVTPQYRYIWSFKASTGDKYGPYISHVTM